MLVLDIAIIIFIVFILYRYIVFPQSFSVRVAYEFRYFLLIKIVVMLGIGGILASYLSVNFVLKQVDVNGFFVGKVLVLISLLSMVLILWLFDTLEGSKRPSFTAKYNIVGRTLLIRIGACVAIFFTLLVVFVYGLPQKLLFSGLSAQEIAFNRTSVLHNSTLLPSVVRKLLARDLSVFISFIFIYRTAVLGKGVFNWKIDSVLFILVFLLAIYNVSFELAKSKLVEFLLISFLIFQSGVYIRRRRNTDTRKIIKAVFLAFLLLMVVFFITFPGMGVMEIIEYFLSRLFVSQISPYFYSVQMSLMNQELGSSMDVIAYLKEVLRISSFEAPGQRLTSELFPQAYEEGRMNYLSTFLGSDVIIMFGFVFVPIAVVYVVSLLRILVFMRAYGRGVDVFVGLSGYCFLGSNFMASFLPYIFHSGFIFLLLISFILLDSYSLRWRKPLKVKEVG